jgi:hypothetical protein
MLWERRARQARAPHWIYVFRSMLGEAIWKCVFMPGCVGAAGARGRDKRACNKNLRWVEKGSVGLFSGALVSDLLDASQSFSQVLKLGPSNPTPARSRRNRRAAAAAGVRAATRVGRAR